MNLRNLAATAAIGLSVLGTPAVQAQSAAPLAVSQTDDLGPILTDQGGRTLYMYTKDEAGLSNCYDQCAANWPPLLVDGSSPLPADLPGAVSEAQRADGSMQMTYNGMPLYYWIADQKPGDATGQNVGGVWFVVAP